MFQKRKGSLYNMLRYIFSYNQQVDQTASPMSSFYKSYGKSTKYEIKPITQDNARGDLESPETVERSKMVKVDKAEVREVLRKENQGG